MENLPETSRFAALDGLKRAFWKNPPASVDNDPVGFLGAYPEPKDKEVIGFLAATLAFGSVCVLKGRLHSLFLVLGSSPWRTLCKLSERHLELQSKLASWKYRFIPSQALWALLEGVGAVIQEFGSLEALYMGFYRTLGDVWVSNEAFLRRIRSGILQGGQPLSPPVRFLLPAAKTSPLKRMNLFLRWMVRSDGLDTGIWKEIPKNRLMVPLDTHTFRLGRQLGLIQAKLPERKACIEITQAFLSACPEDPLSFDMPLSHFGMSKRCKDRFKPGVCGQCPLRPACHMANP
jgi:uncharacterized protein (TIGR02757 family)